MLASELVEAENIFAAQELYHSKGWTDGLPIVPPTVEAVDACLEWALLPPDHLVGIEPVRQRAITAEKLAINAVMAGCTPMHFPVVVTAWTAMLSPEFELHGPTASTGGAATLIVVNGPIAEQLEMNSSFSVLGSTCRSSAVIGRAVRLALINLTDVRPGEIDRSTLGHPGKLSYCIAEDEQSSPWPSLADWRLGLADDQAGTQTATNQESGVSAVTVMSAMAPRQIMNEWTTDPSEICETLAAEMRANQLHYSIWAGNYAVVLPPQLRAHFQAAGWSRQDVCESIFERARVKRSDWAKVGKGAVVKDRGENEYAALTTPEDLLLVAAGGEAGGFAAVIPPWLGMRSRAVTVPVGACVDCEVP